MNKPPLTTTPLSNSTTTQPISRTEFSGKFELPSFLPNDVELWLRQVDTQLELLKFTTESQKYKYVSSCLPSEAVKVESDLIRNEPADIPYTALKTCVKEEFEPTSTAKFANYW